MLLQRQLLLGLLLGLLHAHYATGARDPKRKTTRKPPKDNGESEPEPTTKPFNCATFDGQLKPCNSRGEHDVCVLDYKNKGKNVCQKGAVSNVCLNSVPENLTCIADVGCCCKGDPKDVCDDKTDIRSFCDDNSDFTDKNICAKTSETPKCTTSKGELEVCGTGDGMKRCKIDAAGTPAGCVDLIEGTCDQSVIVPGLNCIAGKGCCCLPTQGGGCNTKAKLKALCRQNGTFTGKKLCQRFRSGSGPMCEDSQHKATFCQDDQLYCKTNRNGHPLGCAKDTECEKKDIKGPKLKCSGKDCCCEARTDQIPCNTWDDFCIENPAASVCTSKARKCVDTAGSVIHCPFNSPICKIDKNGNPDGCGGRKKSINIGFGSTELRCIPGRGCSCNAQFDGPCNTKEKLKAYCKKGGVQDPKLCPGQQRQAKEAARKGDTSGSVSGRGAPAVGLVIMAVFIPRLALI